MRKREILSACMLTLVAAFAAAATRQAVPEAAVRAEMDKRWSDAERIYRETLAKQPTRVDLLLRLADVLAVEGKARAAADACARAADLQPGDAGLQQRASAAFAAAGQPADALRYIDRALALNKGDLELHRRRVQLANWAGDYTQAEESLRALLKAKPDEPALKRDLGRVLGWQGHLDEAARLLSGYLSRVPDDKDALVDLARFQAWRGNSATAADLLRRYRKAGGDDLVYRHEMALVLAWAERPRAALALAEPGLRQQPSDFAFRFAKAIALRDQYRFGEALAEVAQLDRDRPGAPESASLRRTIAVQQRPYLQVDAGARQDSDQLFNPGAELSFHQRINTRTWIAAGGGFDYLSAKRGSGLEPIQGDESTTREFGWIGAKTLLGTGVFGEARIGAMSADHASTDTYWQALMNARIADSLTVQLSNTRDFQIVSPRAVSLGITRIDTDLQLTYRPDLAWTVDATLHEGELSDRDRYLRAYLAPRRAVFRSQRWNVDLGVSGNWYGYSHDRGHGYYAPEFYQQYALNGYVYYKMSEEDGVSVILSLGEHKDNAMRDFKVTTAAFAEATFGQFSDWMWKLRAGYTDNGSDYGQNFSSGFVGLTMVRRF